MFVKICGLRTPATLDAAVQAGADAVGFVFAPGSPRTVDAATVRLLVTSVPDGIRTVGVFRRQPLDEVIATAHLAGVDTVQLHGGEPLDDFDRLRAEGFGTIRALSIDEYVHEARTAPESLFAHRLLIDAPIPGAGEPFDATGLRAHPPQGDWLLAGGLTPDNVADLIRATAPAGVDVSSGVESTRGQKDVSLIRAFLAAAHSATPPMV